jgi:hypothetical protein
MSLMSSRSAAKAFGTVALRLSLRGILVHDHAVYVELGSEFRRVSHSNLDEDKVLVLGEAMIGGNLPFISVFSEVAVVWLDIGSTAPTAGRTTLDVLRVGGGVVDRPPELPSSRPLS